MKLTTRLFAPALVLTVLLLLSSCSEKNDVDKSEAVVNVIEIRILADDFDGAMEALSNCDEAFSDEKFEKYRAQIIDGAREYVSERVDEIIEENGYKEAYDYLENSVPSVLDGASLDDEKSRIRALMVDDIFAEAEELASLGEYSEAILTLKGIEADDFDGKITRAINEYKEKYTADTFQIIESGELDEEHIISLLQQTYEITDAPKVLEALKLRSKPKKIEILESVKHRFSLMRDEKNNVYMLKSKLFDSFAQNAAKNRSGMISAALSECEGNVSFILVLAYSTDELLEPKEVLFNCDGGDYSFSIEDAQRAEKVIDLDNDLEICGVFDSPELERHTLTRLMDILANSGNVVVTAKGLNRDMDFEIPSGQIREIMLVWEAYNVLRESPELLEEVFDGEKNDRF